MTALTVRPAAAEDAAAFAALHSLGFEKGWPVRDVGALLAHPATLAFAAERNGRLVGFVLAWAAAGESENLTNADDPSERRGGVGYALKTAAMALAQAAGATEMTLDVDAANMAGRALYGRLGFAQVGRRKGYYAVADGPPHDALVLRRALLDT
jgi:ribosomal-protein-alanine N-acetyltransferase